MLAPEVPSDIHQLDGVERTAAAPRSSGAMGAFAIEHVLDRNKSAVVCEIAPIYTKVACHVAENRDIDIFEIPGPDVIRFGPELLLRYAWPDADSSRHFFALEHS